MNCVRPQGFGECCKCAPAVADFDRIKYLVSLQEAAAHRFQIHCHIPKPDRAGQMLSLPGWIPGSYLVRDYARHVIAISATCGNQSIPINKVDKASWQLGVCEGPVVVHYEVYAYDLSVRGAYLDTQRAFFNGVCLFLSVAGAEQQPCDVVIEQPEPIAGSAMDQWQVATAMTASSVDEAGFGGYESANYDELIDHPFEISAFRRAAFDAGGVAHEIVLAGRENADLERLTADLAKICETHQRLFDDAAPMSRYVFLTNVVGEGYGGLEHRASSALITRRSDLPQRGSKEISKPYRRFLGLVSHEYFHLWNIKRIKPLAFTPFDLRAEAYTKLLWVFEGITSYYDDLALVRSGVITPEAYFELLADNISKVWQTPGRHRQSLAESSFDAWIKLYKPDENSINTVISYYSKGLLVALCLDLLIREQTARTKSLDDVMRALWQRYGKTGRGLEEDGFEALAAEVSGVDLKAFFESAIRSTDDPPLESMLQTVGIGMDFEPAADTIAGTDEPAKPSGSVLGLKLRTDNGRLIATNVLAGGPAERSGLAGGDELLAIDGLKVTQSNYAGILATVSAGDAIELAIFRRDELQTYTLVAAAAPEQRCTISVKNNDNVRADEARADWLGTLNHRT